jgi:fructosamine-3-kinase
VQEDSSAPPWLARVSAVAGPSRRVRSLGGAAFLVEAGGRALVVKPGPGARDEAEGLRRLGATSGAPPVPEVVLADDELLVTTAVAEGARTDRHDESFGRALAALHEAPLAQWGGGSAWIGACPVDPAPRHDAATFYGSRLIELAERCGLAPAVARVAERLPVLIPPDRPALVHGDLWWGNVLSGADGRSWMIDPSVHGGHPEEDLAMLALFGPVPRRMLDAYLEARHLHEGWGERVELFQLYPLLVHAVLFGGGYRDRAEAVALRFR